MALDGNIEKAYESYADAIKTVSGNRTGDNVFDWVQRLLVPGIQAAATLGLLKYQDSKIQDTNDKRLKLAAAAVAEWCECMDKQIGRMKDATDDVPEPAMYQPVSPSGEHLETIQDNFEALRYTAEYAEAANEYRREFEMARLIALNPKYAEQTEIAQCRLGELINGQLSVGKILNITTDDAESAVINGRIGLSCGITRINLGVETENAAAAGRAERRAELVSDNQNVSPIAAQFDMNQWMLTPEQRVSIGIQQGQLIQNVAQNAYNACAKKPPFLLQKILMEVQKCTANLQVNAGKAGMLDSFVSNYAGIFNSQIRDLSQGLGDGLSGGFWQGTNGSTASLGDSNIELSNAWTTAG